MHSEHITRLFTYRKKLFDAKLEIYQISPVPDWEPVLYLYNTQINDCASHSALLQCYGCIKSSFSEKEATIFSASWANQFFWIPFIFKHQ